MSELPPTDYPLGPRPTGLYEVEVGTGVTMWMTGDEYAQYAAKKLLVSNTPEGEKFRALADYSDAIGATDV